MNPRPSPEERAEERAAERYPDTLTKYLGERLWPYSDEVNDAKREGFATCIREEVEPRDRLIQTLVDALSYFDRMQLGPKGYCSENLNIEQLSARSALASAATLGFTPNPS